MFVKFCFTAVVVVLLLSFPGYVTASGSGDGVTITAREIRAMNANTMSDVLNRVPGVKAGDSSVAIHGSSKIKVFVNGKPINDPTATHGAVRWDMVALENIDTIQVFKGRGGVEHGSDASGGVILITTRKIKKFKGNLKTHIGSDDVFNARANCGTVIGTVGVGLSGEYNTNDGYKVNNDKETHRIGGRIEYSPGEGKDFILTGDYMSDKRGLSGLPAFPTPYSRKETELSVFSLLTSMSPLKGKTYFSQGEKHNTDISKKLDNTIEVKKFGQDLKYAWCLNQYNTFNTGAAYEHGWASGTAFSEKKEYSISAFSSWAKRFEKFPVLFSLGLRGINNSEFDDALAPEVKLAYEEKGWRIGISYNRSNNTPSFYHRYNETSSTIPNPDLTMEIADNYEVDLSMAVSPELSTHLTLFYNSLKDKISYVRDDNGIGQYQNVGEATYKGGDLGLNWKPGEDFTFTGSYTYLEAKDEKTGLWLTAKPVHRVNADFNFMPWEKFSVNLNVIYTSRNYTNKANTKTVPEYLIADIRAEYFFKRFSIFSEIENITDKTYYFVDGLLAPPLLWTVGVDYTF